MTRDVHSISKGTSYRELQETLFTNPQLKAFPVVEDESLWKIIFGSKQFSESRILIGSCSRLKLLRNLNSHVGQVARQQEAARRRQFRRSNSMDQEIMGDTRQNGPMMRTNSELALADGNGNLKKQRQINLVLQLGWNYLASDFPLLPSKWANDRVCRKVMGLTRGSSSAMILKSLLLL